MAKYEIMFLVDPKEEGKETISLAKEIFPDFKGETLKRTELAYEINNSKTGKYIVANIEATSDQIKEFRRRANILKTLWRYLIINLDNEVGREGAAEAMARHAKKVAERAAIREARMKERYSNRDSNREKEGK